MFSSQAHIMMEIYDSIYHLHDVWPEKTTDLVSSGTIVGHCVLDVISSQAAISFKKADKRRLSFDIG
jgi:hypothetical protein